jgi:hypothetical protein
VTTDLLTSSLHDISPLLPARLLSAVLSASKSSSAETRNKAIATFRAISLRCGDVDVRVKVITEILALAKTGKTASNEHRACLFAMTADFMPSDTVSAIVIETLVPLIVKENSEVALNALGTALSAHLVVSFQSNGALTTTTSSTLAKELGSTRIATRRHLSNAVGGAIWQMYQKQYQYSPEGEELIAILAPALEANLQTALTNLPVNPAGYLEGIVAAALAWVPLAGIPAAAKLTESASLQSLLVASPKPSFLLNDKVWAKLPSEIDEIWLLRCLEAVVVSHGDKLGPASVR